MRLSRLLYSFHPIRLVATVFSSFRLSLPGIAAALSGLLVLAIPLFLLAFALPLFEGGQWAALFSWHWRPLAGEFGILPMLAGSLLLSTSAMLLAFPLALGLCTFVHGLGPQWAARPLSTIIHAMTSVPTVVYGLASMFLLVPLIRNAFSGAGFSWLAATLTLSLLVLPTIVLLIDSQFRQLRMSLHLSAVALGFDRVQLMVCLILPLSVRGMALAAVLGFGRAIGDTLLPLMLAGNAPLLPASPLDPLRTLTAHIALVVATDSQSTAYHSLFACGLLLFLVSLMVNLGVRHIRNTALKATKLQGVAQSDKARALLLRLLPLLAWAAALLLPVLRAPLLGCVLSPGVGAPTIRPFFGGAPPLAVIFHGAPVFDAIWPACLGTLCLVVLATALAIPLGIASGIWLAEYASGRSRTLFAFAIELLAGVPSIVMGLSGFALILLLRRSFAPDANTGLLLSAGCLALLILPALISTTRLALENLPDALRLAGASLGMTRAQQLRHLLLPAAGTGILSGVVLAVGRAAEDTAVILLTGVVANAGTPASLNGKYEALPFHIYYLAAEHHGPAELAQAFATALVLMSLTGLLFIGARRLQAGFQQRWQRG